MNKSVLPDIEQLMKQGTVEVKAWLQEAWESDSALPKYGNWWLGLAESAYAKIFQQSPPNLKWAHIATSIYENVNRYSPNGCESCMISSMMLRARLINILGANADDSLLNVQIIQDWFLKSLPLSFDEVESKIKLPFKQLADSYPDDLMQLRMIKNRLGVIQVLSGRNEIQLDVELKKWLNIREKLP
jgi:hypothetical protein